MITLDLNHFGFCGRGGQSEERPRTNLNGGDLVQSTFVVLTFAFALAFMATFVPYLCPCLCSCLSFPLWGQSPYLFAVQR